MKENNEEKNSGHWMNKIWNCEGNVLSSFHPFALFGIPHGNIHPILLHLVWTNWLEFCKVSQKKNDSHLAFSPSAIGEIREND